jgi:hypothetical protein
MDSRNSQVQLNTIRLFVNVLLSGCASYFLYKIMPKFKDMFLKADLKGTDLNKKDKNVMLVETFESVKKLGQLFKISFVSVQSPMVS